MRGRTHEALVDHIDERLSRREVLIALGGVGTAPVLSAAKLAADEGPTVPGQTAGESARHSRRADLVRLDSGGVVATVDRRLGTLYGVSLDGDPFRTNFLGNSDNTRGAAVGDTHWTGDVVTAVWDMPAARWDPGQPAQAPGRWVSETTLESPDTRHVTADRTAVRVNYHGRARRAGGIQSFALAMAYCFDEDHSLHWTITLTNGREGTLELGELALPLRVNDDYAAPYEGLSPTAALRAGRMPAIQRILHEEKVFAHPFVAGHSSYALIQRPRGDSPFLLVHGLGDTAPECLYKTEGSTSGTWIGTDLFALRSRATSNRRGWDWSPWVNGHSSLLLERGESRSFEVRFAFIRDYADIRRELMRAGNLGIRVLPAMVVQQGEEVHVEIGSDADLDRIECRSDGMTLVRRSRTGHTTLLTLRFQGRGQKTLRILYGGNRWTNLHFFCVEDAEQMLAARARFMVDRQFYRNPDDPYGRNHLFLPFDYQLGTRIEDHDDVWEVGGTGDPGFGEPLFLSQKNVHNPSRDEVEKLEQYVSDCLSTRIQNPATYEIRASLYWKARYPSSYSSTYTKARSEETWRTYNYAFAANIYHAMYRIGREYDVLSHRGALDYLRLCYETCRMWFTTGPYVHVGMITGSNVVDILADLRREGWQKEAEVLSGLMRECNEEFIRDPYPFSSEIEIDETGHHQVYFLTRHFAESGDRPSQARPAEVLRALKALRGGDQPVWFGYGNDLFAHPDFRGQIACWHSESLNGLALLQGFEDTGDPSMLAKGYAGVRSVLHNILPDGMGFGWFRLDPGVFACNPARTFEGGPGLWGFLQAARAYVVDDPVFGRLGLGCRIEEEGALIRVFPRDGVRKRVVLVPDRIRVDAATGQIVNLSFDRARVALGLAMEDTSGLVKTVRLAVRGLPEGRYVVRSGDGERSVDVTGTLACSAPVGAAAAIQIVRSRP